MDLKNCFNKKTIAIVYVFENENASGYNHFFAWSSADIAMWLKAIGFLGCTPYVIDTRTFLKQAADNSLPHIDFVLNLNNGNIDLDSMSLVTSICSFLNIPCIPSKSTATIVGENKNLSNLIAKGLNVNVPGDALDLKNGFYRPNNLGNSSGVVFGDITSCGNGIKQEFIKGYDFTTPILYNPLSKQMEVLPSILYYNNENDINWFLDESSKHKRTGYNKALIQLSNETKKSFIDLVNSIDVGCYCRIDGRIKCENSNLLNNILNGYIDNKDIFFIEINTLPTIKNNTGFLNSLNYCKNQPIQKCIDDFVNLYGEFNDVAFVLYCSMSKFIAKD